MRIFLAIVTSNRHLGLDPKCRAGYSPIVTGSDRWPSNRRSSPVGVVRQQTGITCTREQAAMPRSLPVGREGQLRDLRRRRRPGTGMCPLRQGRTSSDRSGRDLLRARARPRPRTGGRDDRAQHSPKPGLARCAARRRAIAGHWSTLMDDGPSTGRSVRAGPSIEKPAIRGSR
jgi:hypothetical protein